MRAYVIGGPSFWRRLGLTLLAACLTLWLLGPLRASWDYLFVAGARRIHPIYRVDTAERKVALSFDACWGAERTPALLEVLRRHGVKTTFFLVNLWLEKYPERAREIAAEGHEIGLHSATHPRFTRLSDEQIIRELRENARLIREVTGYEPKLFRPPFGDYDDRVVTLVQQEGFIPIQWSIDSLDWKDLSAEAMVDRIRQRLQPGSIILFHNNGKHTVEALEPLIKYMREQGYEIVPISSLIYHDQYYIDHSGVQRRAAP
ncbi:MAG: polysaccharide deacetylase family protein [Moorellales bacterium]